VSIETSVRTRSGDDLDAFLSSLAEDFCGWDEVRTWRSLEGDLTLSAEHRSRGYVHLTWGIHGRPPEENWHFETTTVHAAGEDMLNLATHFAAFRLRFWGTAVPLMCLHEDSFPGGSTTRSDGRVLCSMRCRSLSIRSLSRYCRRRIARPAAGRWHRAVRRGRIFQVRRGGREEGLRTDPGVSGLAKWKGTEGWAARALPARSAAGAAGWHERQSSSSPRYRLAVDRQTAAI
jgi:hypothetical protein